MPSQVRKGERYPFPTFLDVNVYVWKQTATGRSAASYDLASRYFVTNLNVATSFFQMHIEAASSVRVFDDDSVTWEIANTIPRYIHFDNRSAS